MTESVSGHNIPTEKIRFERLQLVCRKALEQVIKKSLAIDQIQECYPTISHGQDGSKTLETARSQIIKFWHSSSMKEFELIFAERDIERKLDDLDEIIQVAQSRKDSHVEVPANIDKLSPKEIIEATILSGSEESLENLNMIYNQLCVDNAELYDELQDLGRVSEEIKGDIDNSLDMLKREVETLGKDLKLDDLIRELEPI